jgi:hypothetical protein
VTVADIVEMLGTYSAVITASEANRESVFERARRSLAERFPGATEIDFPMRTWCWRADRLDRLDR